jgi:hypothetical protein
VRRLGIGQRGAFQPKQVGVGHGLH